MGLHHLVVKPTHRITATVIVQATDLKTGRTVACQTDILTQVDAATGDYINFKDYQVDVAKLIEEHPVNP